MTVYDPPQSGALKISVRALLDDPALELNVRLVAGASGLERDIMHPRIQKSGLAMVGHLHGIVPTRIQILGETEMSYAEHLPVEEQARAAENLFSLGLACVIVTRGVDPPRPFSEEAERAGTPLVVCAERSSSAITALHTVLDERLAPRSRIHGVLVDVYEVGVLLLGKSGIGKSECALDLVMRGHRLVADDVIECDYRPPGMVFGQPAPLLRYHIEVRGLGILNIKDLYGVTAIRERKRIDLVVQLDLWQGDGAFDRIGMDDRHREILGVPIREVCLPVRPGRNMSSIIEIAARNDLLRQAGRNPAREFVQRIEAGLMPSDAPVAPRRSPSGAFRRPSGERELGTTAGGAREATMTEGRTLVVVVTGLSGAGKSTALHALEDLGFFCVDNLPTSVVLPTLAACESGGVARVALGIDVRVRSFLDHATEVMDAVSAGPGRELAVLFLDAADEALLRRFSSTRRPHPLSTSFEPGSEGAANAVLDGIGIERERLASLRARATLVIDTTGLDVHALRRRIVGEFGPGAGELPRMRTRFVSFGFKYGTPVDADVVLDVRFLKNPHFVPSLREFPGTAPAVREYVLGDADTLAFLARAGELLEFCLPRYEREGKSYLTVGIGCTGGRHRSVVVAEHLADQLGEKLGLEVDVVHRDIERVTLEGRQTEPDFIGGGPRGGGGTL